MLNSYWLSTPFFLQMLCIAADEFWFHKKRGLPRWERIGHPLDTLTVVLCLAWILFVAPNRRTVIAFAAEQWLHALLFMLHPIMLASAAFLWPAIWGLPGSFSWIVRFYGFERAFLTSVCAMMVGFGVYQFVFWNCLWQSKRISR